MSYIETIKFGAGIPDAELYVYFDDIRKPTGVLTWKFKGPDKRYKDRELRLFLDTIIENIGSIIEAYNLYKTEKETYKLSGSLELNSKSNIHRVMVGEQYDGVFILNEFELYTRHFQDVEKFSINTDKKLQIFLDSIKKAQIKTEDAWNKVKGTNTEYKTNKVDKQLAQLNIELTTKEKLELISKLSEQVTKELK